MATILRSKAIQDEILKWSKSYYIENLLDGLHASGFTAHGEVARNRTHFSKTLNQRASQDGIQVSTIGTLTEAILMAEANLKGGSK